jgi:hypothetical protein
MIANLHLGFGRHDKEIQWNGGIGIEMDQNIKGLLQQRIHVADGFPEPIQV